MKHASVVIAFGLALGVGFSGGQIARSDSADAAGADSRALRSIDRSLRNIERNSGDIEAQLIRLDGNIGGSRPLRTIRDVLDRIERNTAR